MKRRDWLIDFVSGRGFRTGWTVFIIAFFLFFVILPTVYVISYVFTDWDSITVVIGQPETLDIILDAVMASFAIAGIVTVIDFLAGLPIAWMMVRKEFRGKRFLDTMIDMPLAVPTAALGFSAAIFWATTPDAPPFSMSSFGLGISSPFLLIILLHVVFSYPYMVRSLTAILDEIDETYETAGRTLGASRLTAARTITLPLFRAGLATGVILCFARSMSETGGTMIALSTMGASDTFATGPTLIGAWKTLSGSDPSYGPALAVVSIILIVLSLVLLVILKLIIMKFHLPLRKVWPMPEKLLSKGAFPKIKDGLAVLFLALIVLIPSFFIFTFVLFSEPAASDWSAFWGALSSSFALAGIVTVIDLVLGIPFALYISKNRDRKASHILDVLVNVPLIVPTAALGISLSMFWSQVGMSSTFGPLILVLVHVAFTYPLVVRNVAGAVEEVNPSYEETARTLGARPIQSFRRVLYPLVKGSILAGAIMAFTRSLGETGATLAVLGEDAPVAPVYIVSLVEGHMYYQAAMACIILIVISYLAMLLLRYATRKEVA
ncbi:ABC transporter permease [Methanomassiliicoccus luminyensis]|uniref:ABC transporter permease n=1 Tax=Methanomassiliicoccus luminyensis TaxID=1080712 RepID=UPI000375277A|nr:ABC transporter permease subunit [Methanomassiliicoccus luminyensis]